MGCIFCKIAAGEAPAHRVYEDDNAVAFMDTFPVTKGHVLVIPKKHYKTIHDMPDEEVGALFTVASKVARKVKSAMDPKGMNIFQNNEAIAGQVVQHVHVHVMPRYSGEELKFVRQEHKPGEGELKSLAEQISKA